jgi:hypothetical protein
MVITLSFLFVATGGVFVSVYRGVLSRTRAALLLLGTGILATGMFALLIA